ncbi:MAG: hypothetical protein FWC20_10660 [Oscillospiraceae bacterium]|nr:hypothetical protein [Oscillospiraceae bacterium]MCL2279849.1 hypothetical protein [Oscillospiraceae bacterium]
MFVAKSELVNAARLARVGVKGNKKGIIILAAIALIVLLSGLIPAVIMILQHNDTLLLHRIIDMSGGFMGCVALGLMLAWWLYHNENNNITVFPQTNTSRFLAYQIWIYSIVLCSALALTVIYLIQYGVIAALAAGRDNVFIVYDFNIWFVLSGFVVLTIYVAIISAAITLVAALLRKFRLYAAVLFTVLIIFLLFAANFQAFVGFVLGFLILESNLGLFILKGIVVWMALFIAAFVINRYTIYYKAHRRESVIGLISIGVGAVALAVLFIGTPFDTLSNQPGEPSVTVSVAEESEFATMWGGPTELQLEIDISDIPDGSDIYLQVSGDVTLIPYEQLQPSWQAWAGRYLIYETICSDLEIAKRGLTCILESQ